MPETIPNYRPKSVSGKPNNKTGRLYAKNKNLLVIPVLLALTTVAYVNFATFAPKALAEIREVRGIATDNKNKITIPYPLDAEYISESSTSNTKQITLKTLQSPAKAQEFYSTIFTSKGWKVETEREGSIFYDTKYKKNRDFIVVSTSKQTQDSDTTIVSIKIQQN